MTRAKTASQARDVNSTITPPNSISGKHKSVEQSGVTGKGQNTVKQGNNTNKGNTKKAMTKVSEPEFEMSEENQNKIVPRMTRAKRYGQTHDDCSVITQLTFKSGKQKSEEQ
eukprot:5204970-Ditylum_brightwellii.AAC.1